MSWERLVWVDDDGSLTTGTEYTADKMNNIEEGIEETDAAIAAEVTARGADVDAEETARKAADATEKSDREAADASEKSAREGADTSEEAARKAGDAAEKKAREEADAAEKKAREEADTAEETARKSAVSSEETARKAADATEKSEREAADAAEKKAREEADSAEVTNRVADVDAEEAARKAADATEKGEREAADLARPPALTHDASSMSAIGSNTLSWNHEPVTARPRAILVLIAQSFTVSITDQVTSVAYGEQTMTRIGSQLVSGKGAMYAYLLTGKIKPGKQLVVVNTNLTGTNKRAMAISVSGPPLAPVKAKVTTANGTGTAPSISNGTIWDERTVYSVLSGVKNPAPGATQTEIAEQEFSAASFAQWDLNKANTEPGKTEQSLYGTQTLGDYAGIQVGLGLVKDWGLVTELPPSAACAPGDSCKFLADSTNGVIWDLFYDGEGEFPWKKIGGPPLRKVDGNGRTTASPSYQTTGSPSLTLPLKGVYDFEFGCAYVTNNTAGDSGYLRNGFFLNGAIVSDIAARTFANGATPLGRTERGTFSVAGQTVDNRYISEGSVNVTFFILRISLDPVRVG